MSSSRGRLGVVCVDGLNNLGFVWVFSKSHSLFCGPLDHHPTVHVWSSSIQCSVLPSLPPPVLLPIFAISDEFRHPRPQTPPTSCLSPPRDPSSPPLPRRAPPPARSSLALTFAPRPDAWSPARARLGQVGRVSPIYGDLAPNPFCSYFLCIREKVR
jgi:hypothetical protein